MKEITKSGCTKSAENTLKCRNFCTVTDEAALAIAMESPQRSEDLECKARPRRFGRGNAQVIKTRFFTSLRMTIKLAMTGVEKEGKNITFRLN